jgi:single-strand DNA-binding protein
MFETPLTVVGKVITDITQRTTQNGDKMCSFRMVSQERRFNKETQEWGNGDSLFIEVKCWRKLAEHVPASLFKGDHVVAHGRLYLNRYEVNGEPRSMVQLDARAVGPDLSRCPALLQRPTWDAAGSDQEPTAASLAA